MLIAKLISLVLLGIIFLVILVSSILDYIFKIVNKEKSIRNIIVDITLFIIIGLLVYFAGFFN